MDIKNVIFKNVLFNNVLFKTEQQCCGMKFATLPVLKLHNKHKHPDRPLIIQNILRIYNCPVCGRKARGILRHIETKHNGVCLKCDLCSFQESNARVFVAHISRHGKPCVKCDFI